MNHPRSPRTGRARTAALCALVTALLMAYAGSPAVRPADAATARASVDPIAGGPWGLDAGDDLAVDWESQTGTTKALLGRIEGQPRVRWFTVGTATSDVETVIARYIANVQATSGPDALVPLALFRIFPRGEAHRDERMTDAEVAAYRAWMQAAVRAIGSTRAVVVLEPDLAELAPPNRKGAPVVPDAGRREALVKQAAEALAALPSTTVYLDAGDADWLPLDKATTLLVKSGVQYARGFALGATHYSPLASNVAYAKALQASLAKQGYAGRRAVLDTADNGRGFTWGYWHTHKGKLGSDFDNAAVCTSKTATQCVTLGHAPTWGVGGYRAQYVDGYLWFGRPWLTRQASPYNRARALQASRTTPYSMANVTGG
ncbi:glycoside hydrolase family 6 protein [Nocardioides ultimimeridianus]